MVLSEPMISNRFARSQLEFRIFQRLYSYLGKIIFLAPSSDKFNNSKPLDTFHEVLAFRFLVVLGDIQNFISDLSIQFRKITFWIFVLFKFLSYFGKLLMSSYLILDRETSRVCKVCLVCFYSQLALLQSIFFLECFFF